MNIGDFGFVIGDSAYPSAHVSYDDKGVVPPTLEWDIISSPAGVLGDTGFDAEVLTMVWEKYKGCFPYRKTDQQRTQAYLYLGYVYIPFQPTKLQFKRVMYTQITNTISYSCFRSAVVPILECLAFELMNGGFIDWRRRLSPLNHHELFQTRVTTIVDCGPMVVWEPTDPEMHRLLNQGNSQRQPISY